MRTVRTIAEVRALLTPHRRAGRRIAFVPTMGALHDGHLELLRHARASADVVVLSIFVNPTQFDDAADLAAYPRTEERDAELAAAAGTDVLFAPAPAELYPDGFATTVAVGGPLTETLEAAHRGSAHFHGVTTVVTKLLNIVQPDVACFGQKDAQQALVVRRLVRDLDLPVEIDVRPTVREPDGLARSSRNVRLGPEDRPRALALHAALTAARDAIAAGDRDAATIGAAATAVLDRAAVDVEYLAVVDPDTLLPRSTVHDGALVAVAARVGTVRLIDNVLVPPPGTPSTTSNGS